MKLPALGFIPETDPIFDRVCNWVQSKGQAYSCSDWLDGPPGSYRLKLTTSRSIAGQLSLAAGLERALKILRTNDLDSGIISEGVDPTSGLSGQQWMAFAAAVGKVARAFCQMACKG